MIKFKEWAKRKEDGDNNGGSNEPRGDCGGCGAKNVKVMTSNGETMCQDCWRLKHEGEWDRDNH
jgi:hypothetical protein